MDFLSNLLPAVPSLELDTTSPLQNVTFLQNIFIASFLASLGAQTVTNILGQSESVVDCISQIHLFEEKNSRARWSELAGFQDEISPFL